MTLIARVVICVLAPTVITDVPILVLAVTKTDSEVGQNTPFEPLNTILDLDTVHSKFCHLAC